VHPASCILHPASCILHPASCILHPASCILHPASCVLHPASCTLHPLWTVQRRSRGRAARSRGRGRGAQVDTEEDLATYVPRAQLQASADALNREVRPRAREPPRRPRACRDALTRAAAPT